MTKGRVLQRVLRVGIITVALAGEVGCAESGPSTAGWLGTVDTLPGGAIVTRNPQAGLWDPASAWRPVEELRLGSVEGDAADVFGRVQAVEEDALGRIWVLDRQATEIRVFDGGGAFVRRVGRQGSGPGEFRQPIAMVRGPQGRIWVVDPGNARYTAFDTAGAFVAAYRRPMNSSSEPWPGAIDEQGRIYDYHFVMQPGSFARRLIRFTVDEAEVESGDAVAIPDPPAEESVFEVQVSGGMARAPVPFSSTFAWSFDARGFILFAMTGEYRIHQVGLGGDTIRIIERDVDPIRVGSDERQRAIEGLSWLTEQGGRIDAGRIPDTKPPISGSFFKDDLGYLWVSPTPRAAIAEDQPGLRLSSWDVFDPDGRYLGRLDGLPPRPIVRGNSIIGQAIDELGVYHVVRYRIDGR